MENKNRFLGLLKEHGLSTEDAANIMHISKAALYRRINGEVQFDMDNIKDLSTVIPKEACLSIFFD